MATVTYEPVIGLEIHAQILSRSKLFCACSTAYGAPPNTHVCPVCLGLPGALPVPNRAAIEMAVRASVALGCRAHPRSLFARKNYFYPDLAKGYQISQYDQPLSTAGGIEIEVEGGTRRIGIQRIHVEEDAAKNLHGAGPGGATVVDFNRAGVPLVEIVSEPDLRSAREAEAYLKRVREVLMFVGINDGNLEEGSFRCDANVSLRPTGSDVLGTRSELKNINSFRFVRLALEHEISRQEAVLAAGGMVEQETRTWSEGSGKTVAMRGKEEAHDYRYFPDPDLPPLVLEQAHLDGLSASVPELPQHKRERWMRALGVTHSDAAVLTGHPEVARFFEAASESLARRWGPAREAEAGKRTANFMQAELLRHVRTEGLRAHLPVAPDQVAELLDLVEAGTISGKMAKEVFAEMVSTGRGPRRIVEERGLSQLSDRAAIEARVREVVAAHPREAQGYRDGKTKVRGFFVGRVMKATGGAANPKLVNEILEKVLNES